MGGKEAKDNVIVKYEVIWSGLGLVGFPSLYLNTVCKQFASMNAIFDYSLCYE